MTEPLIVVPLDGSELSEGALPYAVALAKATGARLLLVTTWAGADGELLAALPDVTKDLSQRATQYYQEYLAGVAERTKAKGIEVETSVCIGHAADEVLRVLAERDPRLLVMATHGRSGLSRWLYGSVAGELVREAPVPTLAVGPRVLEAQAGDASIHRILVPLDGSPLSEAALPPAIELAQKLGASMTLAQVIQIAAQAFAFGVPEAYIPEIDQKMVEAAEAYLKRVVDGLRTKVPVDTVVLRGAPADALLSLVDAQQIDLVVMASRSRAGLARAFLGSVADRMLQGAAPVLLIRPEE